MNAKKAKQLRKELLPSPRSEVGASRGQVFRTLTEHQNDGTVIKEFPWPLQVLYGPIRMEFPKRIIHAPGTPRAIYRQLKKRIKHERRRR